MEHDDPIVAAAKSDRTGRQIGYVRGIVDKVTELQSAAAAHGEFLRHLRWPPGFRVRQGPARRRPGKCLQPPEEGVEMVTVDRR
jgi:hypothetical protein